MSITKEKVLHFSAALIGEKINRVKSMLEELSEAIQNEGKSSAGDKHETGIAMLHLEVEKNSKVLASLLDEERLLNSLVTTRSYTTVAKGALIKAGANYFFVGLGLGIQEINGVKVILVSYSSPLGKLMIGKKKGESFRFSNAEVFIEEIV
jgi:hypothetical protein